MSGQESEDNIEQGSGTLLVPPSGPQLDYVEQAEEPPDDPPAAVAHLVQGQTGGLPAAEVHKLHCQTSGPVEQTGKAHGCLSAAVVD